MNPQELTIQNVIEYVNSIVVKSKRAAARWHNVPQTTLQGRRAGQQPHVMAHQHQQRLTPEQEQFLVPHFIAGNPRVASIVGRTIENARTTSANYETLDIQYEDTWNMDETRVVLEVCTNTRVLASSSKKKAYVALFGA
ncbi:hypothetical protein COCVIDRAFT_43219 [Bipolaris victoriae FI3]|uniref:HTH psq-type domain-containing protein n=1 Tax=Bipolaris victoriae (strain FI3) TaxID=930091 RepID=W7E0L4_BIPV3|nr:hypothetical protein COCVIDRAFT_43219 [Bipolaris victoriae FI3]